MSGRRPIFYDTETTGFRDNDCIIEIAAYDPLEERTFEQLINPGMPIPPDAMAVHHITDEMVQDAPPFKDIILDFFAFCGTDGVLVAHNNDAFDFPFLQRECARNEIPFPAIDSFDTLKWARRYRRDLPRHSLQFLREIYGISANNAHRALDDVLVLYQVFIAMTDDLPIDQAIALLQTPKKLQRMPFGKHQGKPLSEIPPSYVRWLHKEGALDKPGNEELRLSFERLGVLSKA